MSKANEGYNTDKLFTGTNPNISIFTIEGEEGTENIFEKDTRHSMIGDATLKHQTRLCSKNRLMYHEMICFADGRLKAMEDARVHVMLDINEMDLQEAVDKLTEDGASDEQIEMYVRARRCKPEDINDLDIQEAIKFLKIKGASKSEIEFYCENAKTDISSEDILDIGQQTKVSYEEYEYGNTPSMMEEWEHEPVPTTPKPWWRDIGNVNQMFYDDFEWKDDSGRGHPESAAILSIIFMLKKNINKIELPYIHEKKSNNKKYTTYEYYNTWQEYFEKILTSWSSFGKISDLTADLFKNVVVFIVENNPDERGVEDKVAEALHVIDEDYAAEIRFQAQYKALMENEAYAFLLKKQFEWEKEFRLEMVHRLEPGQPTVYSKVRRVGSELYSGNWNEKDSSKVRNNKMKSAWSKYRHLKKQFAPRLMLDGVDLNRCFSVDILVNRIGFTEKQAKRIVSKLINDKIVKKGEWVSKQSENGFTPHKNDDIIILEGGEFSNFQEVWNLVGVSRKQFRTINERSKLDEMFNIINSGYSEAIEKHNINKLLKIGPLLIGMQNRKEILGSDYWLWKNVWERYRKTKQTAVNQLS